MLSYYHILNFGNAMSTNTELGLLVSCPNCVFVKTYKSVQNPITTIRMVLTSKKINHFPSSQTLYPACLILGR